MVMVYQAIMGRARSNALVVFQSIEPQCDTDEGSFSDRIRRMASQMRQGLKEDTSLFSWANKGQWEAVNTDDDEIQREANYFRIGFEPLFIDCTKSGAWFTILSLVQVRRHSSRCGRWSMVGVYMVCTIELQLEHTNRFILQFNQNYSTRLPWCSNM